MNTRMWINIEDLHIWHEDELREFFSKHRSEMGTFGVDDFDTFIRHCTDKNGSLREIS